MVNEEDNTEQAEGDKFNAVIMSLNVVKETYPAYYFKTDKSRKLHSDVKTLIDKIINHIKQNK